MHWKSEKKFWRCLGYSFVRSPKNIFLGIFFPHLTFVFFWFLGCRQIKCDGDYLKVITDYPLSIIPGIGVYVLIYIVKPLNDYLGLRQEFSFGKDEIVVRKYFKNYFNTNSELRFSRSRIQRITYQGYTGLMIHLDLFNEIWIPFLNENDHRFLMEQFNPEGSIKVITKL